ncbi:MAG: hypothetical protein P0Y55_13960 [Candidatus Cohnella colombiensis]|uniref:Uncharacterized protein n=1 Tax=Candidatus Cohnella colombiensis TaxID=3121368 RepID=A0AA95EVK2_9BACL|nr:MAG: hypothetical protein P0Y55_13960 [Cohnella sp.]
MANHIIYDTDHFLIVANTDKNYVQVELSSSGYRPKFVSHFIESRKELEELIAALEKAKTYVE